MSKCPIKDCEAKQTKYKLFNRCKVHGDYLVIPFRNKAE